MLFSSIKIVNTKKVKNDKNCHSFALYSAVWLIEVNVLYHKFFSFQLSVIIELNVSFFSSLLFIGSIFQFQTIAYMHAAVSYYIDCLSISALVWIIDEYSSYAQDQFPLYMSP